MIGKSWIREQGMQDALLCASLRDRNMDDVPLWQRKFPARDAMMAHWDSLTPMRDGPVSLEKSTITDPQELNELIKEKAAELGASDTGMTALKPRFIGLGLDLPHRNVIAVIVYEDYAKSLEGPDEVDLEAMTAYAKCADIATDGMKRWLTDIEKCYPISRFRESCCHICIDVCPYIWKKNGDTERLGMFRDYMKIRKQEGYKTPKGLDTHPSSERAEQRGHRAIDADVYPTDTAPDLLNLSAAALAVLAREGRKSKDDGSNSTWRATAETPKGLPFHISFAGPDLPESAADQMILPSDITKNPYWQETYHLSVAPPNVALELTWGPAEPLRILNFSRGDWEAQLQEMAV